MNTHPGDVGNLKNCVASAFHRADMEAATLLIQLADLS